MSNSYRVLTKKDALHFIFELLEYLMIIFVQINLYTIKYDFNLMESLPSKYFFLTLIQKINSFPEYAKIIISRIIIIMIIAYFLIYDKFAF